MAVKLFRLLLASAALMVVAFAATIVVHGDWKAVAIAVALLAGGPVLVGLLVLVAMADGAEPAAARVRLSETSQAGALRAAPATADATSPKPRATAPVRSSRYGPRTTAPAA